MIAILMYFGDDDYHDDMLLYFTYCKTIVLLLEVTVLMNIVITSVQFFEYDHHREKLMICQVSWIMTKKSAVQKASE